MSDIELLKLAAKAAGKDAMIWVDDCKSMFRARPGSQLGYWPGGWNPLLDDGDALRLAVKLGMEIYHADDDGWFAYASHPTARGIAYAIEPHGSDPFAATRRAIVRSAAEIGRNLQEQP